jgi:tRNA threonylcarbamoyladenosine biosynthesis protein TsaB
VCPGLRAGVSFRWQGNALLPDNLPVIVLGIETSGAPSSLALVGDDFQVEVTCLTPFAHAESLNNLLAIMEEMAPLGELGGIALSIGPGFFTSLRAGASMAKALAMTLGLPVVGIPTLKALAGDSGPGVIGCALDAKKGQVYGAVYRVREEVSELSPAGIYDPDEFIVISKGFGVTAFAGDGARKYDMRPLVPVKRPSAITVALMGLEELLEGKFLPTLDFLPDYLREPDAVIREKK